MKEKFRKAVFLMSIPAVINLGIAVYCYFNVDFSKFSGYLAGALLGIIFAVLWLWMVKKALGSNPFVIFKISIMLFPVKLFVFMAAAFGSVFVMDIDRIFFGFSFMLATFMTLMVEVKLILDLNRLYASKRKNS